jgi:hypothetical protein
VRAKLLKLRVGSGLKRQFERFASSGGGNLTLPQLKQALLHLGLDLNPTELKVLFSRLDSNASGKIRCTMSLYCDQELPVTPVSSFVLQLCGVGGVSVWTTTSDFVSLEVVRKVKLTGT